MEEEEQLREEEEIAAAQETQEELSPTTDEYQEGLQFDADSKEDYEYDIIDTDTQAGYIPPAPTPAPSMAPLAEMDIDTVDDEPCEEELGTMLQCTDIATTPTPTPTAAAETVVSMYETEPAIIENVIPVVTEEVKKRRKKRTADGKKILSIEEKEQKASTSASGNAEVVSSTMTDADRNAVCPWEDE